MRKIAVIFLLMSVGHGVYGQELTKGLIIKGRDTAYVDFKIPINTLSDKINYSKIQRKIKYYDVSGRKNVVKSADANEIIFYHKDDTIRMLTHIDPIMVPCEMCKTRYIFLELIIDGKMRLFKYYDPGGRGNGMSTGVGGAIALSALSGNVVSPSKNSFGYYFQKGTDKIFSPGFRYKKEMIEYFTDCDIVVKEMKNNKFHKMQELVKLYNANCGD
jgi:hypothetical protein